MNGFACVVYFMCVKSNSTTNYFNVKIKLRKIYGCVTIKNVLKVFIVLENINIEQRIESHNKLHQP